MLHVLLHMARSNKPMTSNTIAEMLNTNPVVVRRTMAGLRDVGYVHSTKGHGGGWEIICDFNEVSLLDIHNALGGVSLFSIGSENLNPECLVEQVVNDALGMALEAAERLLISRLGAVSLAELSLSFDSRYADVIHKIEREPRGI